MTRTIVLKTGSTLPVLRESRGDYEDWISEAMQTEVRTIDVASGEALPDPREAGAIVVTGSSAMVTERLEWSVRSAEWLALAIDRGAAVLGICYGHQLLGDALGGEVGYNPHGREIGSVEVVLNDEGRRDPLLGASGKGALAMQASHQQSLLRAPRGARVLAHSERDRCQAFAYGERVWGVQFHPEWDHEVVGAYLDARREILRAEGLDADALLAQLRRSDDGRALLKRFAELASGS